MTFEQMGIWTKTHDLVRNRMRVLNQILGCRYDESPENPARLEYRHGTYRVRFCGRIVAEWRVYDLQSVQTAFERLDAMSDAFWQARRAGVVGVLSPTA